MNHRKPEDFCFPCPDGHKWVKDMDKDDLLHVIAYLQGENKRMNGNLRADLGLPRYRSGDPAMKALEGK